MVRSTTNQIGIYVICLIFFCASIFADQGFFPNLTGFYDPTGVENSTCKPEACWMCMILLFSHVGKATPRSKNQHTNHQEPKQKIIQNIPESKIHSKIMSSRFNLKTQRFPLASSTPSLSAILTKAAVAFDARTPHGCPDLLRNHGGCRESPHTWDHILSILWGWFTL